MAVISFDCPNCGAKLAPDDSKRKARCQYCGAHFQLPRVTAERPATSAPAGQVRGALLSSLAVSVIGIAVAAYFAVSSQVHIPALSAAPGGSKESSGSWLPSLPTLAGADFMWDDVGGPPQVVVLDGREHVVGRVRVRGDDLLHVAVFAADTGEQRHRVGPFGSYSDGYRATHFAVMGDRLLVTDYRGKLRLFALAGGEPIADIALTDRAERLCLVEEPGEAPRLYLAQVDEREFMVDAAGPALKDAKLPGACEERRFAGGREGDPLARRPERVRKAPKVEGIAVDAVHVDGELAVARGVKSPGTAYPMAFGFDPGTREVRWKLPVAAVDQASVRERDNAHDGLAAGRYFATYGEGSEHWHLTAFDASSGARLWDQKLRSIFAVDWLHGLVATAEHVFLVRMSSVEVYDAATGALKATIGGETYDG